MKAFCRGTVSASAHSDITTTGPASVGIMRYNLRSAIQIPQTAAHGAMHPMCEEVSALIHVSSCMRETNCLLSACYIIYYTPGTC
jgi:hypothetical protein